MLAGPECSGSSILPTRAKEGRKLGWGQGTREELGAEDGEKPIGRDREGGGGTGREGEKCKDREGWRTEKEVHTI